MADYKIFTDSTCDLGPEVLDAMNVGYFCLSFYFTDEEKRQFKDIDMPAKEFYGEMRKGRIARTSGTNIEQVKEKMRQELENGRDILYIGFSSALSTTYNSGVSAANELLEEYPDRKILTVDSLSQSAGLAMLVEMVVQKKEKGASLEEARDFAEAKKLTIAHWFTVDDLIYLKRGGRLSSASAIVGTVLNIKPVIHTDQEGCLTSVEKIRGRKKAIQYLISQYGKTALHPTEGPVFFCHSDSEEDLLYMGSLLKEQYGVTAERILDVGPVIGSHIGPGTVAIFFEAKER